MKNKILKALGKYFEIITIPIAIVLLLIYNSIASQYGISSITADMVGKVFVAFLFFLLATAFVRLVYIFMFPALYKYFDSSFNENKNAWNELTGKERLLYSVWLYGGMLMAFALILNGL